MKYPVLMIGIILFGLFITNPKTKEYWKKSSRRFIPSTCDAVKDRVEKKAPDNWEMQCPGTQLLILTIKNEFIESEHLLLRQAMYKELANSFVKLGSLSNLETLSFLKHVEMRLINPKLRIHSSTDGQAVTELMTKKSQLEIAKHLKLTVKVKEVVK